MRQRLCLYCFGGVGHRGEFPDPADWVGGGVGGRKLWLRASRFGNVRLDLITTEHGLSALVVRKVRYLMVR